MNSVQLGLALKYFRNKEANKMVFFSVQLQSRCNESLHRGGPFFAFIPRLASSLLSRAQFFTAAATFRLFIASTIYRRRGNRKVLSRSHVKLLKERYVGRILANFFYKKSEILLHDLILSSFCYVSLVILLIIAICAFFFFLSILTCTYFNMLSKV